MKRSTWPRGFTAGPLLLAVPALLFFFLVACDDGQSGAPVVVDPHSGMTSYCLSDGSGMRVYERQFPSGGTQPLFSVVYAGGNAMRPYNPAYCKESN